MAEKFKFISKTPWVKLPSGILTRDIRYSSIFRNEDNCWPNDEWDASFLTYERVKIQDVAFKNANGRITFLNTASNVSYYSELLKAAA